MYRHRTLHRLHLHPRDGDLRSQGSQGCRDLGVCGWRSGLWQARWGETKCSWERAECHHLPFLSARFLAFRFLIADFSLSVQGGGRNQVLRAQLAPTGSRNPGGVRSCLSSGARVPLLDSQPQHRKVLAQEVGSWTSAFVEGIKLWPEILRCFR